MIINQSSLLKATPIDYMSSTKNIFKGVSWGLTECGYDIRIKQDIWMFLGRRFILASTIEHFNMPTNLMGRILNKSTWARRGLDASMTTNIEPGWRGWLTLELRYAKCKPLFIPAGSGIAQVIFENIFHPIQYNDKYQDQENRPVEAILT
jgi:dCTP deaminase